MDDGYRTCHYCGFTAKMRKDGTMRKHREAKDSGHIGSTGSFPQDPNGPICEGTGKLTSTWATNAEGFLEEKWGADSEEHDKAHSSERTAEPTLEEYALASRFIQDLMPGVRR